VGGATSARQRYDGLLAQELVERRRMLLADQASAGLKGLLAETLGLAGEEATELAWSYFAQAGTAHGGAFAEGAKSYVGTVVETAAAERGIDRFSRRTAARLRSRLSLRRPGSMSAEHARERVRTAVPELYEHRLREMLASSRAAEEAAVRAQQAVDMGDLDLAEERALIAENEAVRALNASRFVESGEAALGHAEAARIARTAAPGLSASTDVVTAAILAARAAEAARAAQTTVRAVRGARAARGLGTILKLL
jgi:hypothetical protein